MRQVIGVVSFLSVFCCFVLVVATEIQGCTHKQEKEIDSTIVADQKRHYDNYVPTEIWVQECGGCEYVVYRTYATLSGYANGSSVACGLVHKQNCKYCEQRTRNEQSMQKGNEQ